MTRRRLNEIERTAGFTYPASFISRFEEFSNLLKSDGCRRVFPAARLLLSPREIAVERSSMPDAFIPFMREEQPSWPDIYAFDLESDGPEFRVVVWSDHAVVMDWQSFPVFNEWVVSLISKHDQSS
jgi:hypothetical protein